MIAHKEKVGGQDGEGSPWAETSVMGTGPEPCPHLYHMDPMEMVCLLA